MAEAEARLEFERLVLTFLSSIGIKTGSSDLLGTLARFFFLGVCGASCASMTKKNRHDWRDFTLQIKTQLTDGADFTSPILVTLSILLPLACKGRICYFVRTRDEMCRAECVESLLNLAFLQFLEIFLGVGPDLNNRATWNL